MNNKGFTLVELITTFAVASAIALVLFNVVLTIKNIYSKTNIKTNLLINQANLSNQINSKSLSNQIVDINLCDLSTHCYTITYSNGESYDLVIKNKSITFGNYVYNLDDSSSIDENNINFCKLIDSSVVDNTNNSILNIKIPIKNKTFENKDFGLNYVYLYSDGDINFNGLEIGCES